MKKVILLAGLVFIFIMTSCGKKSDGEETLPQGSTGEQTESGTGATANGTDTTAGGTPESETGEGREVSLQDLRDAVVEVIGENYWPDMTMEEDMFADMYGVTSDMYDAYLAETPMIGTNVDTLIIVKAKEGQVGAVEEALNTYRDNLVNDTMQYPMNIGKIQASRIETFDDYVCFVQLGADVTDLMDQGEDTVIEKCQEENEKALEAIRIALSEQ